MSEEVPGQCRSLGCTERAEFFVELLENNKVARNWSGEFCHIHLVRCLDLKVIELSSLKHTLVVERIVWVRTTYAEKKHKNMIMAINRAKAGGAFRGV